MAARTERWEEASSHSRPQMMARKRVNGKSSANGVGATKDGSKRSGMWAKLQKGAQAKAAGSVIDALQKRDALSLKAGVEERRRRREEIAAEWGREQTREMSLLVPPPPELPDEEIPTRSAQLKSRSRGPTANGEIDPGTKQELEQFEQLEAAVAEHEDFHWSGGFGTLSKRRHDGRVVWKAVCDANEVAFDEEQATELEEQARKTSEVARTLGSRMDEDPVNRGLKAKFMRSVEELHAQRPYFQTADPSALKVRHRRMPWQRATGDADDRPRSPPAWRLEDSIFSQRAKESDAKSFLTPPKLARMQVEMDWSRVIAKSRFQKLLRKAMGHSGIEECNNEAFKQDLSELEDMVLLRYPTIRSAFYYYCARGTGIGEVSFSLLPNQWTTFCRETGITDPVSAYCSQGNLQSLFIATNFEEGGAMSREEDVENDDNALMRFEWVEILIRVAIEKYIKDKQATNDVREAFVMLCDENLSQLPRDAVLDCNEFRQQRLYTPAVDSVLREHHSLLKALFKVYKARDSAKWFGMEHWVAFLDSVGLVGSRSNIGLTHAKLLFMWSQMDVVDELRRRQRVVGWSFTDFLEGIARLADVMQLPTPAELEDMRKTSGFKLPGKLAYWEYLGPVSRPRTRPTTATGDGERKNGDIVLSANEGPGSFSSTTAAPPLASSALGDGASPSRPLEEKLDALLNLLVAGLSEVWNVEGVDSARLAERLTTMATFLSGGIEIGH
uniref:Uncharacterized protein n=1 Tax=Tetraselmis chuii TaxID=63592 RepID=A0A6U1GF28_9CHLO